MSWWNNKSPNLIGNINTNEQLNNIIKEQSSGCTISDKISSLLNIIYYDYIKDNYLSVLFIVLIIVFLIYRYNQKQQNTEETFSPLYPISKQYEPQTNYYPEKLPLNIHGDGPPVMINNAPQTHKPTKTDFDYDYNNVYKYPSRSTYTGTYDTYKNAQDTDIQNPLGFSNNFNTTTGNYVTNSTMRNTNNIATYQAIIDEKNKNLVNSMRVGPSQLYPNEPEYEMEPPYSDDI